MFKKMLNVIFWKRFAPRWDVRTSNPGGAAWQSLVGSTPILFRPTFLSFSSSYVKAKVTQ